MRSGNVRLCLRRETGIGGLVLWQDSENYLRLVRGIAGKNEITFMGCIGNRDIVLGRGRLSQAKSAEVPLGSTQMSTLARQERPPAPDDSLERQVYLRMERRGDAVRALCSADVREWFAAGQATFPVGRPIHIGVHATGSIDRTIYHGAYPGGSAIRFQSFRLWQTRPGAQPSPECSGPAPTRRQG